MHFITRTEDQLWTVFNESGSISDHPSKAEAQEEANRLNGAFPLSKREEIAVRVFCAILSAPVKFKGNLTASFAVQVADQLTAALKK